MSSRTLKDVAGRVWKCAPETIDNRGSQLGQDVAIVCTSESPTSAVRITVGWRWMYMDEDGLARLIASAAANRDSTEAAAVPE